MTWRTLLITMISSLLALCFVAGCGGSSSPSTTPLSIALTPASATVPTGQGITLYWTSTGATSVTSMNFMTPSLSGYATVYPTQTTTYSVTAHGPDSSQTAVATVTVSSAPMVLINPKMVTLTYGDPKQFTAAAYNTTNPTVVWNVVESGGGTITPDGLYTAPQTNGVYHVTATSVLNPSLFDTATVTVQYGNANITLK